MNLGDLRGGFCACLSHFNDFNGLMTLYIVTRDVRLRWCTCLVRTLPPKVFSPSKAKSPLVSMSFLVLYVLWNYYSSSRIIFLILYLVASCQLSDEGGVLVWLGRRLRNIQRVIALNVYMNIPVTQFDNNIHNLFTLADGEYSLKFIYI